MNLAPSPHPWACKTVASAGPGDCRLGRGRLPGQVRLGSSGGPQGCAETHWSVSMQQEEVLVLQNGFERGFCCVHPATVALPPGWAVSLHALRSVAVLGSTLCPICARQRPCLQYPLPFLLAVAESSARLLPPRCPAASGRADPAQPSPRASAVCVSRVGVPVVSVACRRC